MVPHNIHHDPNITFMALIDEVLEVILSTEMTVHLVHVTGPIAMVTTIMVVYGRRDPDSIETKVLKILNLKIIITLQVIEPINHTSVVSSAVIVKITAWFLTIASFESKRIQFKNDLVPISQDLVDGSRFPFFLGSLLCNLN